MAVRIKEIADWIEALAPKQAAFHWDHVGLEIGSPAQSVERVLVALEVTPGVLEEAIEKEAQLVVVHHPFFFKGIKEINPDETKGKLIYQAIQNGIAIYSAHTNIDGAAGGLNDQLAIKLGIQAPEILDVTENLQFVKLVVFVPKGYEEQVMEAMAEAGAGHIGNYSHCTFRTEGIGTFMPLEEANPFLGTRGKLEQAEEIRLETVVEGWKVAAIVEKMKAAHPYEEVAYDLYPTLLERPRWGIGRYGKLDSPRPLNIYAEEIKAILGVEKLRIVGDVNQMVEKVCVVNGSGAEYITRAAKMGCDLLVTGDVKYHDAQLALELGIQLIDAGHFDTEAFFVQWMASYLEEQREQVGADLTIIPGATYINPFQYL